MRPGLGGGYGEGEEVGGVGRGLRILVGDVRCYAVAEGSAVVADAGDEDDSEEDDRARDEGGLLHLRHLMEFLVRSGI